MIWILFACTEDVISYKILPPEMKSLQIQVLMIRI